jgi:signal peptide peptidase SppA
MTKLLSRIPWPSWLKRAPQVAVLRLDGVIMPRARMSRGISIETHAQVIEQAFKLSRAKAVAIVINSPGGSPTQSALVHDRIRALADEKELPVYIFCEDVAASGGYWIACAGDEIYAKPSSIVGSIGVISAGFGFVEAIGKLGVERRLYTAGERKSLLDPFRPEDPEDVARLKGLQGELHEQFKSHVRDRRGGRLKVPEADLFTGEFWTGQRALDLGLIDGLGDVRQVMREKFGEKVRLKAFQTGRPLLARLGLGSGRIGREFAASLADEAEQRLTWNRVGL